MLKLSELMELKCTLVDILQFIEIIFILNYH